MICKYLFLAHVAGPGGLALDVIPELVTVPHLQTVLGVPAPWLPRPPAAVAPPQAVSPDPGGLQRGVTAPQPAVRGGRHSRQHSVHNCSVTREKKDMNISSISFPTPVLGEGGHTGEVSPQVPAPGPGLGPAEARPRLPPQVAAPRVQGASPARPAAARPSCSCSCSSCIHLRLLAEEVPLRVALHIVPVPRRAQAEAVLVRLRAAVVGRVLLPLGVVPDRACVDIVDIICTVSDCR